MRKKLATLLLLFALVVSSSSFIKADNLYQKTAYDLLQGGWTQRVIGTDGRHWTSYLLNSNPIQKTVIATVKVMSNPVETRSGINYAKVTSRHYVGPYDTHIHSKVVP